MGVILTSFREDKRQSRPGLYVGSRRPTPGKCQILPKFVFSFSVAALFDAKTPSWCRTDFGPSDPRDMFIQVHGFSIDPFCSICTGGPFRAMAALKHTHAPAS